MTFHRKLELGPRLRDSETHLLMRQFMKILTPYNLEGMGDVPRIKLSKIIVTCLTKLQTINIVYIFRHPMHNLEFKRLFKQFPQII